MVLDNQEMVNKGAALLDRILPGWHRRLQLRRLDMKDIDLCVLGQLFGRDTEMALAREMYPEEFINYNSCGYAAGKCIISAIPDVKREDYETLAQVCSGIDTKCEWANAVSERLIADEDSASRASGTEGR